MPNNRAMPAPPPPDPSPAALPPGVAPAAGADARERPASLSALFVAFTLLALQGFGGVLMVVQRELVERRRWMSREEFIEEWAVAQIMPGPNVVNLGLILGDRFFGWRGAAVALLGLLTVPMALVLVLALLYSRFQAEPAVAGALRGMAAVAAGGIIATGLKLIPALRQHALGRPLCAAFGIACFAAIAWLRWPLVAVLLSVGGLSCVLTWRKLAP
jgi:chromate transporter